VKQKTRTPIIKLKQDKDIYKNVTTDKKLLKKMCSLAPTIYSWKWHE